MNVLEDLEMHYTLAEAASEVVAGVKVQGQEVSDQTLYGLISCLCEKHSSKNEELLRKRGRFQNQIDDKLISLPKITESPEALQSFLKEIGYIVEAPKVGVILGSRESDISTTSAPQCVLPADNKRFATRGAERFQSLLDAIYGSNLISEQDAPKAGADGGYNPERGKLVFKFLFDLLDKLFPLEEEASWSSLESCAARPFQGAAGFRFKRKEHQKAISLKDPSQYIGKVRSDVSKERQFILEKNGLRLILVFNSNGAIGKISPGGLEDVLIESVVTTIYDAEDSVSSVSGQEKSEVYRTWNRLNRGTLSATFDKGSEKITRGIPEDIDYNDPDGNHMFLKGRSTALIRHVGIHLKSDLVLRHGKPVPEGLVDLAFTVFSFMANAQGLSKYKNTSDGSMLIVKPKLQGPEECAFFNETLETAEDFLGLERNTLKVGLMDEEFRTSVNLSACIKELSQRIVFVNTGFLDRTGDQLSVFFMAGPTIRADHNKTRRWFETYEKHNVQVALDWGFKDKAQIGKGMYAFNTDGKGMWETKQEHPEAGANCAWVPSPSLAALHALHYMLTDVRVIQETLKARKVSDLNLCNIPVLDNSLASKEFIQVEVDQNLQGLLGYFGPWILNGIGCSSVPDIRDRPRMEDLATARIKAMVLANWLKHGIITLELINERLTLMVEKVDQQNSGKRDYIKLNSDRGRKATAAVIAQIKSVYNQEQPGSFVESSLRDARKKVLCIA